MALSSKHKITLFSVILMGFIGFLIAGLNTQQFGPASQPVVRQFPEQSITLLMKQEQAQSTQLFRHEYQLVNVWASWCGVCRKEHTYLNQLAKFGIPIIGLNYRDQRSGAVNYLGQLGNPYSEVMFDPKGVLSLDLGVVGTPETYLVDQSGAIVYKHLGVLNQKVWDKHFADFFADGENS
ncbi:DsbE family thiol:disulfide interchange protein [Vibrio europaeus]|uniref:DsbE family thiol:disulfide interchange protein n=1 Tax=Vibrio europaeus TaxID=300876 RepID=UPI00148CD037|nr:DsbE family thiol:disulfide interchange protein [Vibrio europaeus]NOH25145.1 DsbE family thiol:disulfide interchange protein [Vibrio europaeus]